MLRDSDLIKIRQRSAWDEEGKKWSIPSFILTEKKTEVSFPTINGKQRVEQARDERGVLFEQTITATAEKPFQQYGAVGSNANSVYASKAQDPLVSASQHFQTKSDFGAKSGMQSASKENSYCESAMLGDRRSKYHQMS